MISRFWLHPFPSRHVCYFPCKISWKQVTFWTASSFELILFFVCLTNSYILVVGNSREFMLAMTFPRGKLSKVLSRSIRNLSTDLPSSENATHFSIIINHYLIFSIIDECINYVILKMMCHWKSCFSLQMP